MRAKMQTINLLGKCYTVRCPEGKERELEQTAELLSKRLQETKRNSGLSAREDIIMMTALNMCHEELQNIQSDDADESVDI